MSGINNDQNNQACPIQCDAKGAKFSQVSDTKLSWEGTNWASRSMLKFGCWLSNKFLSSRCVAQDNQVFKTSLSEAWRRVSQEFQNLNKANPFTCFMFACRMAHSFDKASSGKVNLAANDASPTEGGNISKSEQGRPNEVSKTNDPSSQKHNEVLDIREYLSTNNALPPEAVPYVKFYISNPKDTEVWKMCINRNGEGECTFQDGKTVPTRNVKISDDNDDRHVIITGEYCDESDNNTWKPFLCKVDKKDVFYWQSVNNSLDKLARDETIELSEFVNNIPKLENRENVINATAQGENDGEEVQLKIDNIHNKISSYKEVSVSKIDGEEKIPLSNPKIVKGSDSEHVIITAQDNGQRRSFVVELRDLIDSKGFSGETRWESWGTFDVRNYILNPYYNVNLTKYLEKKGISLEGRNRKFILDDENNIERKDGKWYVNCFYEGKIYKHRILGLEIRKIPGDDEHVLIEVHNGYSGKFKVKLADLLSEDGWVEQKEEHSRKRQVIPLEGGEQKKITLLYGCHFNDSLMVIINRRVKSNSRQ